MVSVREVMEARSVAVIGASRDPLKPGSMLLKLLKDAGFQGKIAGINPQGGEVHGFSLYDSIDQVPFSPELAVMIIPPPVVPQSLKSCAAKGVKGVVIASEGFAEIGEEGKKYQEAARAIFRATGMRGFGPNTLGIVNTMSRLTSSYLSDERMLRPGSIGFVSQSGIFVGALLRYLSSFESFRISKGLGLGNKVDVDEAEALAYLMEDDQTRIVGMYLEDIRDGRRFLETAREAVMRKPILLLKGGKTAEGARATASHTGSLAVDDAVLDGSLRQAGVLRMSGIEELIGTLMAFQFMPLPSGDRIAFVTFSGAQAIMSIDAATECGLHIARFADPTQRRLAGVIANASKARNPVDIYPDMNIHGFEKTVSEILLALLADEGVDGVIFISFAVMGAEPYRPLVKLVQENLTKPVFFSVIGRTNDVEECRAYLEHERIPFYLFPEMGVRAFANMYRYVKTIKRG